MGTLCRESRVEVHLAMIWVMVVAKTMCHVVKNKAIVTQLDQLRLEGRQAGGSGWSLTEICVLACIVSNCINLGKVGRMTQRHCVSHVRLGIENIPNLAVARTHLLKMMTPELQAIQTLQQNPSSQHFTDPPKRLVIHCYNASRSSPSPGQVVRTQCRRQGEDPYSGEREEQRPDGEHHPRASCPPHRSRVGFPWLKTL